MGFSSTLIYQRPKEAVVVAVEEAGVVDVEDLEAGMEVHLVVEGVDLSIWKYFSTYWVVQLDGVYFVGVVTTPYHYPVMSKMMKIAQIDIQTKTILLRNKYHNISKIIAITLQ